MQDPTTNSSSIPIRAMTSGGHSILENFPSAHSTKQLKFVGQANKTDPSLLSNHARSLKKIVSPIKLVGRSMSPPADQGASNIANRSRTPALFVGNSLMSPALRGSLSTSQRERFINDHAKVYKSRTLRSLIPCNIEGPFQDSSRRDLMVINSLSKDAHIPESNNSRKFLNASASGGEEGSDEEISSASFRIAKYQGNGRKYMKNKSSVESSKFLSSNPNRSMQFQHTFTNFTHTNNNSNQVTMLGSVGSRQMSNGNHAQSTGNLLGVHTNSSKGGAGEPSNYPNHFNTTSNFSHNHSHSQKHEAHGSFFFEQREQRQNERDHQLKLLVYMGTLRKAVGSNEDYRSRKLLKLMCKILDCLEDEPSAYKEDMKLLITGLRYWIFCKNRGVLKHVAAVTKEFEFEEEEEVTYEAIVQALLREISSIQNKSKLNSENYEAEIKKFKQEIAELHANIDGLDKRQQDELRMKAREFSAKLIQAQEQIDEMKQNMYTLESQNHLLVEAQDTLRQKEHALTKVCKELNQENVALKQEIYLLKDYNKGLEEKTASLNQQLQEVYDNYKKVIVKLKVDVNTIKELEYNLQTVSERNELLSKRAAVGFDELTPRPNLLPMAEMLDFDIEEFSKLSTIKKVDKMMGANSVSVLNKKIGRGSIDGSKRGSVVNQRKEVDLNGMSVATSNITSSNANNGGGMNASGSKSKKKESSAGNASNPSTNNNANSYANTGNTKVDEKERSSKKGEGKSK